MKAKLFFTGLLFSACLATNAQTDANGYTTVEATMGTSYANRVFFDLSENKLTSQSADTWDIALYRVNGMQYGTRVNDAKNIKTYQVSANPDDWENVNISNIADWGEPLYNPDKTESLQNGAFEQSTLVTSQNCPSNIITGWGCYNFLNHHIEGKVIFVLQYPDTSYVKFMITDYFYGYTIKYAKSNGSTWGETITKTIANGSDDQYFNYFSFDTNDEVKNLEPARAEWDFMLTRYWTFYNNVMMYRMSGILQSPRITVARTIETQKTAEVKLPAETDFKKEISTIGHSWKPTSGLIPNVVYYIKENDQYYRLFFTQNGGAGTGNMYFKYKNITNLLSTADVKQNVSFGIYPNPAPNKQVTLLYDVKSEIGNQGKIQIFDLSGRKVYETDITKTAGFFKKELNLHQLSSGIYLVNLSIGTYTETKKLILK
ncbi:MAG: T9SS type A sorting domain-containing protein [Cruoricaptor ignavus]|nr:T9SS type A sorting domain-containing protein [Cruoricaptor ignavus]